MSNIVVLGAGPIGLATAMLLGRDGHEVTVFEKDEQAPPARPQDAWEIWQRDGVVQFRQTHFMMPRFRHLLDAEFPDVRANIEELGGKRFNLINALPPAIGVQSPRPGDDRFETLTARRPILESAFARAAERTRGVTIRRGVTVVEPVAGPSARPGIPYVTGVRTRDGAEHRADLVIDAMGRRSKLGDWVVALGGRPPYEEASDAGFAYYTRHFRSRDGSVPAYRGPVATAIGTVRVLTVVGDNGTWTIAIVPMAGDQPLKTLRHNEVWERVLRAIPHAAHWLDGEPLCDVMPMAGVLDRYRRVVVDQQPVVTGLVPVGDSWACTNPTAGRGFSMGLAHALALRAAVREHLHDPAQLMETFDQATEETVTPWYRDQVNRDRQFAAQFQAMLDGRELPAQPPNPVMQLYAAIFGAASSDPDMARVSLEVLGCLALPTEILRRPGMQEKVAAFVGARPAAMPGPTRAELLALVS
jgi:2-polyprenyl-6-methoxyphenol hydroxylase-like FAD-dependent oxidoreductase